MTSEPTRAQDDAREDFVWNMHTDYSGVAREAFDGGYEAGVAAERERAARIAEHYANADDAATSDYDRGWLRSAWLIARAIREDTR